MGQYHTPVCIEAEEGLYSHDLDCGLKEWEQLFNRPGTVWPIVALVCAKGGNMPADLSQSQFVGRWAGKRVLVQGDYAEDTDIPNWDGPPLSLLYSSMNDQSERDSQVAHMASLIAQHPEAGYQLPQWDKMPFFKNIGGEARDFLEGACNVRFFSETQTWTTKHADGHETKSEHTRWNYVWVKPSAREFGGSGVAEYVLDPGKYPNVAAALESLKHSGMKPIDIQRVPKSGDWHGMTDAHRTEGHVRVIVNLDTMEYLDPVKFGQTPTLAGMVSDAVTVPKELRKADKDYRYGCDIGGGLFVLLCHPEQRGGGDLPAKPADMEHFKRYDDPRGKLGHLFTGLETLKGRWRGGRILGTNEIGHEDFPTTEEVIEKGTDISSVVLQYLAALTKA